MNCQALGEIERARGYFEWGARAESQSSFLTGVDRADLRILTAEAEQAVKRGGEKVLSPPTE